ncbi:hypothetical protein H6P81_009117 [Aristolochia fimbriata]|uniref:Pentatricopeptide repeat-containing protein n=1 Tax=Aristolochia fimbriata TaxID=158543 RepID=A0AAV7EJX9_ARIFI|nr:hypothetical protein H6P81_009117 [Aristolochia fimbriata]
MGHSDNESLKSTPIWHTEGTHENSHPSHELARQTTLWLFNSKPIYPVWYGRRRKKTILEFGRHGLPDQSLSCFLEMRRVGIKPNEFTFSTVVGICSQWGMMVFVKLDLDLDIVAAASMVDMYSKCGSLVRARQVFDGMAERDLVTWNAMISGCAQNSCGKEALELFSRMQVEGILPNSTTSASTLKALSEEGDVTLCRYFHVKVIKFGWYQDVFSGTALVDMYSKCSCITEAERAFNEMPEKNLIAFNAIISGYGLNRSYRKALKAYMILLQESMIPDSFTFSGLISSCISNLALFEGTEIHAQSLKHGLDVHVSVANSLVSLYSRCHLMDRASRVFDSVLFPTVISWTGIITGFAQNGEGEQALKYFCKMHRLLLKPDEFAVGSILKAIANWATVEQGRNIHSYVVKVGLELDTVVGTALVDMYLKCGVPEDSFKIFINIPLKNIISWNSMIVGFAQNGLYGKSLQLFNEMLKVGINPSCVTFIGVLAACSHACLVDQGRYYFNLMSSIYGISPSVEHYTCLVDLLGRAGHLSEAEMLIINSPFSSDPTIWRSLLAACGFHKDMHVGVRAAENCLKLEPRVSATYVALSNMYASMHSWDDVSKRRNQVAVGLY